MTASLGPVPGLTRVDHIGLTVPDLDEAHAFFVGLLGCKPMYEVGPFAHDDDWMSRQLGVAADTVMRRLRFFRLGGQAIFEVFEYDARDQAMRPPLNSDVGGHHVALYVEDLDAAVAHLRAAGVEVLGEPVSSSGPSQGQRWIYFRAPWGLQLELVSYPEGKAYDRRSASSTP